MKTKIRFRFEKAVCVLMLLIVSGMTCLFAQTLSYSNPWQSLGSNQYQFQEGTLSGIGRFNCVAIDPSNSNIIYAGSDGGGVWKTLNGGTSWTALGQDSIMNYVSCIAVDPQNTNIVYVGISNGGEKIPRMGVYKTTNGGTTWQSTGYMKAGDTASNYTHIWKILPHPSSSGQILISTTEGIFKSVNGGTSWTVVFNQPMNFIDLVTMPGYNDSIYVTKVSYGNTTHFYRAGQFGSSAYLENTTISLPETYIASFVRTNLSQPNWVYLAQVSYDDIGLAHNVFYLSKDKGITFSKMNSVGFGKASYRYCFDVSKDNVATLYVGDDQLWKSTDTGKTWVSNGNSLLETGSNTSNYIHPYINDIATVSGNKIFVATAGFICTSQNAGTSWTKITTTTSTGNYYKFSQSQTDTSLYGAMTQDNGEDIHSSSGWKKLTSGTNARWIEIAQDNKYAYIQSEFFGYRYIKYDLNDYSISNFNTPGTPTGRMLIDNHFYDMLYYPCNNTIYKSADGGIIWSAVSFSYNVPVQILRQSESSSNVFYAVSEQRIFKSTDSAKTWTEISPSPSITKHISSLAIDPTDPNYIVVAFEPNETGIKVAFSSNSGSNLTDISGNLPNFPSSQSNHIEIVYQKAAGVYYCNEVGVYFASFSTGQSLSNTWHRLSNGLPNTLCYDIGVNYRAGKTRVSQWGRGLWQSTFVNDETNLSPANLSGRNLSNGEIELAWLNYTKNYTSFTLERAVTGNNYNVIQTGLTLLHTLDKDVLSLSCNATIKYRVKAVTATGSTAYSNVFTITRNGCGTTSNVFSGIWEELGRKDYQYRAGYNTGVGRFECLAVHPYLENIMYAGTAGGGIWKTVDGGAHWKNLTDNTNLSQCLSIVIDPTNTEILYAVCTGYDGLGGIRKYRMGVFKSIDGGNNWTETGLMRDGESYTATFVPWSLLHHSTRTNEILAATTDGIYKTIDGGSNWSLILSTPDAPHINISSKPSNPDSIYITAISYGNLARFYWGTGFGSTVSQNSSFSIPTSNKTACFVKTTPTQPNWVYVSSVGYENYNKISLYLSKDNGISFQKMNTGSFGIPSHYESFDVSKSNPAELYIGDAVLWRSVDTGKTWVSIPNPSGYQTYEDSYSQTKYIHPDVNFLCWNNGKIYVCTDGFVSVADTGSTTTNWKKLTKQNGTSLYYGFAQSATNRDIYAGNSQDNASDIHTVTGWSRFNTNEGTPNLPAVLISPDNSYVYINSSGTISKRNFSESQSLSFSATSFLIDHHDYNKIFKSSGNSIYLSTDGGAYFYATSFSYNVGVSYLKQSEKNSNYIFAVSGKRLFVTTDLGDSWSEITSMPTITGSNYITCIALDPADVNKIVIGISDFTAGEKVFYSSNGGTNWTNISTGLPNVPVRQLSFQKHAGIYIATEIGTYFKSFVSGGLSNNGWESIQNNLPKTIVTDIEPNYISGKLRASTFGRGLWQRNLVKDTLLGPANLGGWYAGSTTVKLAWLNYTKNYSSFTIERSINSTTNFTVTQNGITSISTTGYLPGTITPGDTIRYRVKAILADGSSTAYSDIFVLVLPSTLRTAPKGKPEKYSSTVIVEDKIRGIKVYPNPASERIAIEFMVSNDHNGTVKIFDANGKSVKTESHRFNRGRNLLQLNINHLPGGMYTVAIYNNNNKEIKTAAFIKASLSHYNQDNEEESQMRLLGAKEKDE